MTIDEAVASIDQIVNAAALSDKPEPAIVEKAKEVLHGLYDTMKHAGYVWEDPVIRIGDRTVGGHASGLAPVLVIEWSDAGGSLKFACTRMVASAPPAVRVTTDIITRRSDTPQVTEQPDYANILKHWNSRYIP